MRIKIGIASAVLAAVLGVVLVFFGSRTQVAVFVDGKPSVFYTHSLTVGNALANTGLTYSSSDRVIPSPSSLLPANGIIQVNRSHLVYVIIEPGGTTLSVQSADLFPGNLLLKSGILLFPADRVLFNGVQVDPGKPLPFSSQVALQFRRAQAINLDLDGQTSTFYSSAFTVGQVLSEIGIHPGLNDGINPPAASLLGGPTDVQIKSARLVNFSVGGKEFSLYTRADTVGEALDQAGIPLQYLDSSIPPEGDLIPEDGRIKITPVNEKVVFTQITTLFGIDYISDPNTPLDQTSVVTPGQYGLSISRQRIATADGTEISHVSDAAWQVALPVNQQVGYGTKAVLQTIDTPNGPLQYWRTANVYVTSYSPCRSAADRCYTGTSSGMKAGYGVVASTLKWYKAMKYQQFYIPGYGVGTLGDVGGGFPDGRYWLDLGYDDSNWVEWGGWITVYFLAPIPSWFPQILP